ncbi:MAG: addiction module toxin RelE [Prevotella sp.]
MSFKIIASRLFAKELKRLGKKYKSLKNDYQQLLDRLEKNPSEGVDLGHGLRKVRMSISAKNKGKSHGARIITFNVLVDESNGTIHLVYIYDKEERSSISKEEISELLKELGL